MRERNAGRGSVCDKSAQGDIKKLWDMETLKLAVFLSMTACVSLLMLP